MKEIQIKKYVKYLFGIAILVFILNKLYIRPWLLENDVPDIFLIVTYSIPNLIEANRETLLLTGVLLQIRQLFYKKFGLIVPVAAILGHHWFYHSITVESAVVNLPY